MTKPIGPKNCNECGVLITGVGLHKNGDGKYRCKECQNIRFKKRKNKNAKARYIPHKTSNNCYDCGVEIISATKNRDGNYRCKECQCKKQKISSKEAKARYNKTNKRKECQRKWAKTAKGKQCLNRARKAFYERNPELEKARSFIASVNQRLKKYHNDLDKFRQPHTRQLAEILLDLPIYCESCRSIENLQIDHIYPLSKLTKEHNFLEMAFGINNLQRLCLPCNSSKSNKVV